MCYRERVGPLFRHSLDAASLMLPIVSLIFRKFDPGPDGYWTLAVDDSPTLALWTSRGSGQHS
jgi:hypothetical protein